MVGALKNRIELKIPEEKLKILNLLIAVILLFAIIMYDFSRN
jgi:hypothetical protein